MNLGGGGNATLGANPGIAEQGHGICGGWLVDIRKHWALGMQAGSTHLTGPFSVEEASAAAVAAAVAEAAAAQGLCLSEPSPGDKNSSDVLGLLEK